MCEKPKWSTQAEEEIETAGRKLQGKTTIGDVTRKNAKWRQHMRRCQGRRSGRPSEAKAHRGQTRTGDIRREYYTGEESSHGGSQDACTRPASLMRTARTPRRRLRRKCPEGSITVGDIDATHRLLKRQQPAQSKGCSQVRSQTAVQYARRLTYARRRQSTTAV